MPSPPPTVRQQPHHKWPFLIRHLRRPLISAASPPTTLKQETLNVLLRTLSAVYGPANAVYSVRFCARCVLYDSAHAVYRVLSCAHCVQCTIMRPLCTVYGSTHNVCIVRFCTRCLQFSLLRTLCTVYASAHTAGSLCFWAHCEFLFALCTRLHA